MQDILQLALQGKIATAVSLYYIRFKVTREQAKEDVRTLVYAYNVLNAPMQVGLAAAAEYEEAIMGQDIYDAITGV